MILPCVKHNSNRIPSTTCLYSQHRDYAHKQNETILIQKDLIRGPLKKGPRNLITLEKKNLKRKGLFKNVSLLKYSTAHFINSATENNVKLGNNCEQNNHKH